MRIISTKTLKSYLEEYPQAREQLIAWAEFIEKSNWNSPQELKIDFANASILSNKRVVFNIKGNHFRLIVDIEYRLKIVFVVWFGSHQEYDKIDAKTVSYVKSNS